MPYSDAARAELSCVLFTTPANSTPGTARKPGT
jgi:hypothetical protein